MIIEKCTFITGHPTTKLLVTVSVLVVVIAKDCIEINEKSLLKKRQEILDNYCKTVRNHCQIILVMTTNC